MSAESPNAPRVYANRWARELSAHAAVKPYCRCVLPECRSARREWSEVFVHAEEQDVECRGWQRLNELIEDAARDGREEFSPVREMTPDEWTQITELPTSIAKLTSVKHLILYGSSLVRIPPAIGEMESLEEFTPYTSYRLHWFPYEIRRCRNLRRSTISTRALYGNWKFRPPFPRLEDGADWAPVAAPDSCSVCSRPLTSRVLRRWISLWVASDVVPLLVHACSMECIESLPRPQEGYFQAPHRGGLQIEQPKRPPY